MQVDTRRIYPLNYDDRILLNEIEGYEWRTVCRVPIIRASANAPLRTPGSFRKYRLRATYYDDERTETYNRYLELMIRFEPPGSFKTLRLQKASCDNNTTLSSFTEMFTSLLRPEEDGFLAINVQFANASVEDGLRLRAALYSLDLETWEFSSPSPPIHINPHRAESYAWTRPLFPASRKPVEMYTHSGDVPFSCEINLLSYFTERQDSHAEMKNNGQIFGLTLRTLAAAISSKAKLTVTFLFESDSELDHTWEFTMIPDTMGNPFMIHNDGGPWYTNELFRDEKTEIEISITTDNPLSIVTVYQLHLDVVYAAQDSPELVQRLPNISKAEDDLISGQNVLLSHSGEPLNIGMKHPFVSSAPILGMDEARQFVLRLTLQNQVPEDTVFGISMTLVESGGELRTLEFSSKFKSTTAKAAGYMWLSEPFQFHDGRYPSLPADDWTLKLSYFGGIYNNGVCYLLDVSLEARDHPIVDLTVPRSVQLALDITEKSIEIPHSQVLAPGSTPFTLAMWCSSLGQYIDADEPEDDYFHIICSYGETLTMGITNEGVLRAELSHKDGSPRTVATIAGHGLNEPMVWHHLAITWDTTTLRLTVDGVFPSERFHAEGPLLESPNAGFVFGGKTFAGFIRSVSFWSSALEQDSICKAMYTVPGTQPGLLAAIEFSSGKPLIVCPKAKEVGEFQLPTGMKYVVEGRALAVAPAGCVSLGRDEALHMVGNQSFTLEVWFSQSVTQGIQMLAGRVVDSTHGYVLGLTGDRIFGRRDDVIVVMPLGFNFDPSLFWHRAGLVYDAQFETLTLYVDGVRASQESCSTPSLHLVVDAKDVAFTVGGRIDPISEYLYEDSFCGWIGQVCVWKAPRSPHHMKHSLINLPDPGAPALAGYFGFDGISMTNIGYGSPPLCLGNAQISDRMEIGTAQYLGSITGIDSRLLALPLDPSVSTPTPATSPNQVERMKSTEELIAEDDESTRIWLEFMVDLFAAVLEAVGFDIEDKTCLVQVCSIIWDHDRIRSSVVGFSQLDEKSLISLLDGVPSHRSLMMAADSISSPIENSSKRDVDPHIVTTMVVGLVFDLVRAGLFRNLIKAVPKVSWWSLIRVEAKLVPYVGEVYLAFCVMRLSFKIIKAILRLKERIKENEEKNSRPGLVVKWIRDSAADVQDVVVIPLGTVIPLRVGGSYQKMAIGLNPPSSLEPVTVALQVSQLGLELSLDKSSWIFNTVITFPPKVYGFQTVFVRASEIAAVGDFSTVSVVMKANAPAREVRVKFDIRKQSISAEPAVLTLDADKVDDYRIFSVWMDAIIDRDDQKIKLRFKESKDNQLDDDLLDLKFDPETIEFKRANDVQHKSTEIEVKVSLKQKKNFEKSLDRAIDIKKHFKIIEESGTGVAEVKRDIKVTGTHTTIITMIRAGKGDCYIVSDRLGNETQFVHALIDGGARGTHGRIKAAMNDSELNIEKFEFINCTHYDDDHIRGLLDMFKKEPNRKFAKLGLFNDPDSAISDRLSNPPPLPRTEIGEQDIEHSCLHPLDAAFSTYRLGDNLGSPNQGRALVTLLRNACDKVLGPENHGPAVSNPTQDSLRDYHFGNLNVAITGPTSTNRTEMNGTPGDSVKCNRSSTILTFRSQPEVNDGFNALFTGDAHDTLPSHNDIRGKPDLTQLLADHFLVMKVPHHGSGLSEDESFYKAYTADIYLISSYYKVHKIPKIQIIRSMVQGCSEKKKSPKFFTTSTYNKDTLYENMENDLQLKTEFLNAGAEMWFFADGTDYAKLRFNGSSLVEWPRTMMLKWP